MFKTTKHLSMCLSNEVTSYIEKWESIEKVHSCSRILFSCDCFEQYIQFFQGELLLPEDPRLAIALCALHLDDQVDIPLFCKETLFPMIQRVELTLLLH